MTDEEKRAHDFSLMIVSSFIQTHPDISLIEEVKNIIDDRSVTFSLYEACYHAALRGVRLNEKDYNRLAFQEVLNKMLGKINK